MDYKVLIYKTIPSPVLLKNTTHNYYSANLSIHTEQQIKLTSYINYLISKSY